MSTFYGGLVGNTLRFHEVPGSGLYSGIDQALAPVPVGVNFSSGTAADQVDGVALVLLTLAVSTPQNIDLSTLVDFYTGATLTVARLRFAAFKNLSKVDGPKILIGNAGTNEYDGFVSSGGTIPVFPSTAQNDGIFFWSAPNTTAGPVDPTHKVIKCDPGSTAQVLLAIFGTASL